MTEAQKEYIITEDMLTIWMNRCINLSNPHTEGDICKKCEYRGKGGRKNCCDFDDNAIRRMFRSRPYKSDAVLDERETFDIIRFLKKRYGEEEAILDSLENVEDEVLAVQREQKER